MSKPSPESVELASQILALIGKAIDAAVEMIDRLKKIESAAQNLVNMKGRHNTEIAYQRLVAALEELK